MDDQEQEIYDLISYEIKMKYANALIFHQKLKTVQEVYPAISVMMIDNSEVVDYNTFENNQIVCQEKYRFEAAHQDFSSVKDILAIIDQNMKSLGYIRTYVGIDENQETNDIRRISEYEKLIIK